MRNAPIVDPDRPITDFRCSSCGVGVEISVEARMVGAIPMSPLAKKTKREYNVGT